MAVGRSARLALALVAAATLSAACERAAVHPVTVAGSTVYFKLYGERLALSLDGNPCRKPDPERDYLVGMEPVVYVYYRVEGARLVVDDMYWKGPVKGKFGVAIAFERIPRNEEVEMERLRNWNVKGWNRWQLAPDTSCSPLW
jgi:hypothetical protein